MEVPFINPFGLFSNFLFSIHQEWQNPTKIIGAENACPLSMEDGQASAAKGWKLTHIPGMISAPGILEKHIRHLAKIRCSGKIGA